MFRYISIFFFVILAFALAPAVLAQEVNGLEITPHIIDVKAQPRDILEYNVVIKNNNDHRVTMYLLVYDLSADSNHEKVVDPNQLDKTTSVTRWVRISRGAVEIDPGQEVSRKLSIEVDMRAKPGKYYGAIVFSEGRNITVAESNFKNSKQLQLLLNVEVEENIIEKAQIQDFASEKNIFLKSPANFDFSVANSGNRDIVPQGYLYIYNRKSQEVAKLPANPDNLSIKPDGTEKFSISWDMGNNAGKFKAKLELEYGQKERHDLNENLYFWVLPWKLALFFGIGLLLVLIILAILIFKKTYVAGPAPGGYFNNEPTVDLRSRKK